MSRVSPITIEDFPEFGTPTSIYILTLGRSENDSLDDLEQARLAVLERLKELPGGIANIRHQWIQKYERLISAGFSGMYTVLKLSPSLS